jgi:hypothetical protein
MTLIGVGATVLIGVLAGIKVVTGLALFALSSAIYGDAGKVDWSVAAWLAAGTAVGSYAASGFAGSNSARKWVYLALQISVTLETLLLVAGWLGWVRMH